MKNCPQCSSVYPEDYVFCLNDGTILKDADDEQETVVSPKVNFGQTTALAPDMLTTCGMCDWSNRASSKFCKKCGAALSTPNVSAENQPPRNPPFNFPIIENQPFAAGNQPVNSFQSNENSASAFGETVAFQSPKFGLPTSGNQATFHSPAAKNKSAFGTFLIGGGLLGIVLIGGIVWYASQPHPAEAKLDRAITDKQLFAPAGDNAFELYQKLKKDGADAKVLKKYEDRLFPILAEKPEEILKTTVEPGITEKRLEEWQDAARMLEWASEMRPADNRAAAKAAYFKGRVNYLTEQKDAAIADWKRAADFDKKWAVPLNGIGLIYNERKDYEAARTWLRQAIEREPSWAIPYNNLGSSYFLQDRFAEAAPFYQKAVELAPRWARPHAWLASIAMKNYDCSTAVSEFERVLAPDALGASEMNLDSIRKQYEKAQRCNDNYGY
ncbi:MAG: tetratricopeptide repeat protein [Pyrinomonadaceae bacterium]|nr:tetratricopeptide repeat protein [Pyrinomonadaceae bacterium]